MTTLPTHLPRKSRVLRLFRVLVVDGFAAAPWWMTVTAALFLAYSLAAVFYPVGIRIMVDAFLHHDRSGIIAGALLVCILYSLQWVLSNNAASAGTVLADRVNLYLSAHIAATIHSVGGVEHLETPDYIRELDLLDEYRPLLANGPREVVTLLSVLLRIAGIVVLLGIIWWPLALLPVVILFPVLGDRFSVRLRERADNRTAVDRHLANELFEIAATAGPAKELRVFGLAPELSQRHRDAARRVADATARAALTGGIFGVAGWMLFAAGFGAAVVAVALRAIHGTASVGEVVLAVTLVQRAQFQVSVVAGSVGQVLTMVRSADRLFWIEDYAAGARPRGGLAPVDGARRDSTTGVATNPAPDRLRDGIALENVCFRYPGSDQLVLADVDLHLPAGATVALIGANGAGKTTLVKLLTRMYEPTAGDIGVDGVPLGDIDLADWRARTSAAFQDFLRPELVTGHVVGIGDMSHLHDNDAIARAVEQGGATDVVGTLDRGLRQPLGLSHDDGRELSGGQWQKLALARSMMRPAPLLLVLDEPTANLDAPTESALFHRYVDAVHRGRAAAGTITLLVSHRFSTVALADVIVLLESAHVAECGSHADLMSHGGIYAELYELQTSAYR